MAVWWVSTLICMHPSNLDWHHAFQACSPLLKTSLPQQSRAESNICSHSCRHCHSLLRHLFYTQEVHKKWHIWKCLCPLQCSELSRLEVFVRDAWNRNSASILTETAVKQKCLSFLFVKWSDVLSMKENCQKTRRDKRTMAVQCFLTRLNLFYYECLKETCLLILSAASHCFP